MVGYPPQGIVPRGVREETASYVVFKVGAMYYAKNGRTGQIEFSGTDASTVIQSAIDALTDGGRIFIKKGTYELSTFLEIKTSGIILEGEGYQTFLKMIGTPAWTINVHGTASSFIKRVQIRNMRVLGNSAAGGGAGVTFYYAEECKAERLWVEDADIGIALGIDAWGEVHYSMVINCVITNNKYEAIYLSGTSTANGKRNIAIGNVIYAELQHGIHLAYQEKSVAMGNVILDPAKNGIRIADCVGCVIIGNTIYSSGEQGILLAGVSYNNIIKGNIVDTTDTTNLGGYWSHHDSHDNLVIGNVFVNTKGWGIEVREDNSIFAENLTKNNTQGDMELESYASNCLVRGNRFADGSVTDLGTNNVIRHNLGYVTENEGVATFSGDGSTTVFNIAHGLAGTPTKYGVSPLTPDADADRTVTVDATNIVVTFSVAPPTGTDNVKFGWWAKL